jgi:hypothetical protein
LPEFFEVDRDRDADYQPLCGLSQRIAALVEREACASSEWAACLDDLLGAVYSLFFAIHHDFSERPNALATDNIKSVQVRANHMANGRVRTEGKWTAGFYLNNALFRIAAVYHRALKLYMGDSKSGLERLVSNARAKYKRVQGQNWESGALWRVTDQVNNLKHRENGIIKGRDVGLTDAIKSADELLALIEAVK